MAWRRLFWVGALGCVVCLPLWAQSLQIPAPEEAIQQADQLPPDELFEQITQLEIDAEIRDKLRFDLAWQPMVKAVQQDVMQLKWGNSQLENPVWQRYGAKAYPLLDYYARSADPTRQAYGLLGIRSLGKPYTTRWLERQIQRRSLSNFYLVSASEAQLATPESAAFDQNPDWQPIFGLDDPQTRNHLVQLAQANLEPPSSPTYYDQFNLGFLTAVLGYEAVFPTVLDSQPTPVIPFWDRYEQLSQPSLEQVQQAIAAYRQQPRQTQDYILVKRLGKIKAGEISTAGRQFLQALANNDFDGSDDSNASADQIWALAELDRHGDLQASDRLQAMLNGNLEDFYPLTRLVSYVDGFSPGFDKATHAYYLLLGMTEKYPQSRFVQAAREYGNLRGFSYFGGEPRNPDDPQQSQQVPRSFAAQTAAWQSWLNRYPDHPGADDATYFIARGWQDQNQILAALDLWVQLMTQQVGDSDATYLAWGHVRSLLDVGLSLEQLEKLPQNYRSSPILPLFRYALAVHYARQQNYAKALEVSQGLDLSQMSPKVLETYYNARLWSDLYGRAQDKSNAAMVQQSIQAFLIEQRQRWQTLQQLQIENTPTARYQIAANWASEGGWKNGYLALWDDQRTYALPTSNSYFCQIYWVCNVALRGQAAQTSYQQASQNAIALSLFQQILKEPATPAEIQEESLFMVASTLLWQWEDHPYGETLQIHPPIGVSGSQIVLQPDNFEQQTATDARMKQDYLAAISAIVVQLQQKFPDSHYIDDLLFSRYAMSGDVADLQTIVERYPSGDRVEEARFLLSRR